jgi:tetratricopeptide (TPR) repeat protein
VTARVLDGADSSILWTGSVKGGLDEFYSITGKIASNVASGAGVYVEAEKNRFPGREVFDQYTRGLVLVRRRETDKLDEAVRLLSGCVGLEPDFVPAYAALAEAYLNYQNLGVSDDPRYLSECERSLREGLRRDGQDADLHMMLARLSEYRYDWGTTSEQVRRVIELKPSGLDAPYILKATELARRGRIDEALESYRQARGINPFNPVPFVNQIVLAAMTGNARAADEAHEGLRQIYAPREFVVIGDAWWTAGRGDLGAAAAFLEAENQRAPHPLLVFSAAEMAFAVGDYDRAAGHLESWLSRNRYSLESYWLLGLCRELQGDEASARANARQALRRARELAGAGGAEPLASFIDYFGAVAGEASPEGGDPARASGDSDTVTRYLRALAAVRRGDRSALGDAGTPYDYSYWLNRFSARELELLRKGR